MDTRFSIAIHLLILIAESDVPLSSARMAESVGTNPSFARKILGLLREAGLVSSRRGKAGCALVRNASEISLLQIYRAVHATEDVDLFGIHGNPNDDCVVGRYIQPVLKGTFSGIQREAESRMGKTSLAECIEDMRARAISDGVLEPVMAPTAPMRERGDEG